MQKLKMAKVWKKLLVFSRGGLETVMLAHM